MEKKQSLPEYLKQLRRIHRYKQEDVARKLNICRQTYSHYETGRIRPSIRVMCYLAQIYGISVEEILKHVEFSVRDIASVEISEDGMERAEDLFRPEFLSCFLSLDERDRRETLSIMWEIMQIKKKQNGDASITEME